MTPRRTWRRSAPTAPSRWRRRSPWCSAESACPTPWRGRARSARRAPRRRSRQPYPVAVESPNTIRCTSNGTPAMPLLDWATRRRVDAVGTGWDVPGLGDDAASLVGLHAQQVTGSQYGGTRRRDSGRGGERNDRPTRCTYAHATSLEPDPAAIRVAACERRSHCGIKSGTNSGSSFVERNRRCQAKLPGWLRK